ncbi:MAG: hypothetical protein CVU11_11635 [Bacteroidetes bacterium HGW-Bacteroidetes-6]|jgi:hypothetical protein|nr:MAG: hypothetical protein CVU11_11635 [Bacteroidetes bacterium HGW-Bacteroidetes-6]
MILDRGYVRRLNKSDASAVFAVRQEAYQSSEQFKVLNFSYLEWDDVDDIAIVLGVFNQKNELLASLRGEIIRTRQEAEAKLHYSISPKLDLFPGVLLGRGATSRISRNKGFNSLLRYYYLGLGIDFPFKSMFASVFEKAPRIGLLRDMNYRFTIPDDSHDSQIHVVTREYFVYLERKQFLPSFKFLETKFKDVISRYPWTGLI